jgi:hypothetical protein
MSARIIVQNGPAMCSVRVEHLQPMQRAITLGRRPDSHPSLTDLGF